jgi:hypothetical protein
LEGLRKDTKSLTSLAGILADIRAGYVPNTSKVLPLEPTCLIIIGEVLSRYSDSWQDQEIFLFTTTPRLALGLISQLGLFLGGQKARTWKRAVTSL